MNSAQRRLQFLVRFAFSESVTDSPPAEMKARSGLVSLLGSPVPLTYGVLQAVPDTSATDISRENLGNLQRDVRDMLLAVADPAGEEGSPLKLITVDKQVLPHPKPKQRYPLLVVAGQLRDVFLEVVTHLLMNTPTDRIRRCPGCETAVFYRTGRQTHCSPTCRRRAYWSSLSTEEIEAYRSKQYAAHGWTRGARKDRLQRIATKARTGGKTRT